MLRALRHCLSLDTSPRLLLFFPAIVLKLLASALSGAAFVLSSGPLFAGGLAAWALWFGLLFIIALPQTDERLASRRRLVMGIARVILIFLVVGGVLEFGVAATVGLAGWHSDALGQNTSELLGALQHSFVYNDGTALCHQAVDSLLAGENPYAQANIVSANLRFGNPYDKTTPIRTGEFAHDFPYPTPAELSSLWQKAIKTPSIVPPELESRLGYPAGCFLLPAPFIAAGIPDLRLVFVILLIPALAYVVLKAPRGTRLWLLGGALASLEIWNGIASGETGSLYFPFLLLGWVLLRRNWWASALFMGLAVAIKQVPWFFIPFYLILAYKTYGARITAGVLGVVAGVFVALNLPFVLQGPELWAASVLSPIKDELFPLGVGLVSLVSGGYLKIESPLIFSLLEAGVGVVAIVWYWFNARRYPHTGLILAVLPLFFAWRSLWPYFFYFDVILLALVALDYGSSTSKSCDRPPMLTV